MSRPERLDVPPHRLRDRRTAMTALPRPTIPVHRSASRRRRWGVRLRSKAFRESLRRVCGESPLAACTLLLFRQPAAAGRVVSSGIAAP